MILLILKQLFQSLLDSRYFGLAVTSAPWLLSNQLEACGTSVDFYELWLFVWLVLLWSRSFDTALLVEHGSTVVGGRCRDYLSCTLQMSIGLGPDYSEFCWIWIWIRTVNCFKNFESGRDLDWVDGKELRRFLLKRAIFCSLLDLGWVLRIQDLDLDRKTQFVRFYSGGNRCGSKDLSFWALFFRLRDDSATV